MFSNNFAHISHLVWQQNTVHSPGLFNCGAYMGNTGLSLACDASQFHHPPLFPIISYQSHCKALMKSQWWPCSSLELVMVYLHKIICDATNYDLYDLKNKIKYYAKATVLFEKKDLCSSLVTEWLQTSKVVFMKMAQKHIHLSEIYHLNSRPKKCRIAQHLWFKSRDVKYPVSRFLAVYHISLKSLHSKKRERKKMQYDEIYTAVSYWVY